MSTLEEKQDFCQEYINKLPYEDRGRIFDLIRLYVNDDLIDSSNSDGSRIYYKDISEEAFNEIYKEIINILEN